MSKFCIVGSIVLIKKPPGILGRGSAFIAASYLQAWREGDFSYRADHRWTPYSAISRHAKLAVIASEDQKFAFHPGFDFEAIDQALAARERGKPLRGASTISQQVAKNLFLWGGQSFLRKGLEAYLGFLPEGLPLEWTAMVGGSDILPLAETILRRGGHISVGLGDYAYTGLTNAQVAQQIVRLADKLGIEVATPAEVRQMLGMS